MDIKQLEDLFKKSISHYFHQDGSLISYDAVMNLTIDQPLEGDHDITDILENAMYRLVDDPEEFDWQRVKFKLHVMSNFENVSFSNKFSIQIIIENCAGSKLDIVEYDEFLPLKNENIHLTILNSSINNVKIQTGCKNVLASNLTCDSVWIEQGSFSIFQVDEIGLSGTIKLIKISNLKVNQITINQHRNEAIQRKLVCSSVTCKSLIISDLSKGFYTIRSGCQIENVQIISFNRQKFHFNESNCSKLRLFLDEDADVDFLCSEVRELKQLTVTGRPSGATGILRTFFLDQIYFEKDFLGNISDVTIKNNISFTNVTNRGELNFTSTIMVSCNFKIKEAVLGKISFFNCIVRSEITFMNSNIEEIQFYGQNGPFSINVEDVEQKILWENRRTAYRQLKISSNKQGDREMANFYRSQELYAHYGSLEWKWGQFGEKFAVWANKSNEQGQNWGKALSLMFFLSAFLYGIFILTLGYYPSSGENSIANCIELWKYYLDFTIPGYLYPSKTKFAFLADLGEPEFVCLPFWTKLIVYLNDILVVPYLIVQMVSAFRKHLSS